MSIIMRTRLSVVASAVTVAVGATVAGAAAATPAGALPSSSSPGTATSTHVNTLTPAARTLVKGAGPAAEAKAISSYWTPARMKAAVSLDKQTIAGKAPKASAIAPHGAAKTIKAAAPVATLGSRAAKVSPKYDFPNLPYYSATARTVGKVFFSRTSGGQTWNFVCSGAIVNTEGKSTLWTAGHCVYDYANGKSGVRVWDNNFTFVPSYSNGSAPYGYWTARNMTSMNAWINNRDFTQDNGAAFINRNSSGYRLADYLGAQGLAWNQSANYYATAFGYPQAAPFNGAYLVRATGNTVASGSTIYMYSGMTGGSSGGPWLRNYDGNYGSINGHNDFVYTNSPNYMYSPYYGNQIASLYNAVRYQSA